MLNNFSFACCHQYVFFKKLSFQVFCPSFFFFFSIELYELFLYLDINPFSVLSIANIFSHLVGCLLILSVVFITVQKLLKFNRVLFVYFCIFFLYLQLLFSHSVVSDSLWPHRLQHTRLPYPSLSPRICSNSMFIESVMPYNHLILCLPLVLLPSIFLSIRVSPSESVFRERGPGNFSIYVKKCPMFSSRNFMASGLACMPGCGSLWVHLVWDPLYFPYLDVFGFEKFSAII